MNKFRLNAMAMILVLAVAVQACKDETTTPEPDPTPAVNPIVGTWKSQGTDVAPLLGVFFNIDSIGATFRTNNTYSVAARDTGGTIINYAGTYSVTESGVANIYNITLNQSAPTEVTSQGIYRVFAASPDSMYYEVIQTTPSLPGTWTAPTAAAGFGSTAGPNLPAGWNLQKFRKN
jgi:hypothetical protein